jgi:hypothetical protein
LLGEADARSLAAATDVDVIECAIGDERGGLIVGDAEIRSGLIDRQKFGGRLDPLDRIETLPGLGRVFDRIVVIVDREQWSRVRRPARAQLICEVPDRRRYGVMPHGAHPASASASASVR